MKIGKTKVNGTALALIILSASIIGVAWYVQKNGGFNINLDSINNIIGGSNDNENSNQPPTYQPPTYNPPDYTPPSSSIKPTSLVIQIHPNPAEMGDPIYGQVVSNGKDYSVTVHASHLGTGTEQSYSGLLGDDGKFTDVRQIYVPGYLDFWATSDDVTSNTVRQCVEGVLIDLPIDHYSHTFGQPVTAQLYSHSSGNAQINAIDHESHTSTYLTNAVINTHGFGEISLDFDVLPSGYYEIEVIVNGLYSGTYDGSAWLTVGR